MFDTSPQTAQLTEMATTMFAIYNELVKAGFTEEQALKMVLSMIGNAMENVQ